MQDLVDDDVALLDTLDLAPAHLVGISMGGGIAQYIAVEHPHKVATLTLLSTSPAGPAGPDKPDLPPPAPRMAEFFSAPPPEPDWTDRAATIDYLVAGLKPFAGGYGVDEPRVRAVVTRMYDRTTDIAASQTNHWILDGGGQSIRGRLGDITAPTLVLHGTDDPRSPSPTQRRSRAKSPAPHSCRYPGGPRVPAGPNLGHSGRRTTAAHHRVSHAPIWP